MKRLSSGSLAVAMVVAFFAAGSHLAEASNFWTPMAGFPGGNVLSLAWDSTGIAFAGTEREGIYRSADGGAHWSPANVGFPGLPAGSVSGSGVLAFMVAPNQHVFASVFGTPYSPPSDGVYRSVDAGDSWQRFSSGLPAKVTALASTQTGVLIAGGQAGGVGCVYQSRDDGVNWHVRVAFGNNVTAVVVDSFDRVYAATDFGLRRSTDEGMSWTTLIPGGTPYSNIRQMAVNDRLGHIYLATTNGLYRMIGAGVERIYDRSGPLAVLADDTILMAASGRVLRSHDSGATWPDSSGDLTLVNDLEISKDGSISAATFGNNVYVSSDGGTTWIHAAGIRLTEVDMIAAQGNSVFASTHDGHTLAFHVSPDLGANWTPKDLGECYSFDVAATPTGALLNAAFGRGILRSIDGGSNWSPASLLGNPSATCLSVAGTAPILAGFDKSTLYPGVLYRSIDDGVSWSRSDSGITYVSVVNAIARHPSGHAFAACSQSPAGIFTSLDQGAHWSFLPIPGADTEMIGLVADGGGALFAVSLTTLHRSVDEGLTWAELAVGAPWLTAVAVDGLDRVYVGTRGWGVFRSEDGGDSWQPLNTGLQELDIRTLEIDDGYALAGTDQGAYRSTQSVDVPTGTEAIDPRGLGLAIHHITSNPGRGDQHITYSVARSGTVHRRIFDVHGRLVSGSAEWRAAGSHRVAVFGRRVMPGLYLVELEQLGKRAVRRVVVIQ